MIRADRREGNGPARRSARAPVAAVVLVVLTDQLAKWWAWREIPQVRINYGGDPLVGPAVGAWYAGPVTGALLDLLGAGLLAVAVLTRLPGRHPVAVRLPAALAIGGWTSNLLDRLGMHHLTAPGSVRGAVDFIPIGRYCFNVADFFIIAATLCFVVASARRRAATKPAAAARHPWPALRKPARVVAATGAVALVAAVTVGAADYGGSVVPPTSPRAPLHQGAP
ncbi:signal peptidase II [Amycolatopsis sp. lyj-23]|uniref:signal peptidase II n=1 Tax=Amycolatopsis sp. lyj-23 TaxID=2789283 RepID=UPI00397C534B